MNIGKEVQIDFIGDFEEQMESHFPKSEVQGVEGIIAEIKKLSGQPLDDLVKSINDIREELHKISPFASEPVDYVKWVKCDDVTQNDYNPNKVAPAEMKLLELSIHNDGYTQPIVAWGDSDKGVNEVIDGFHRSRVGKESAAIKKRVHGYLPIVDIRTEQSGKKDRMASTIRHNRARGKHQIDAMSEIVIELKNRNWRNARIAKELGMDEEEVLRLCQISGMESLFSDKDFSNAWEAEDSGDDWEPLDDNISDDTIQSFRVPNVSDGNRVFHTYDKWECHKAGFYASNFEGMTAEDCKNAYASFLSDCDKFMVAAKAVASEWKHSCEHYLTNTAMNRIAWIGQAAMCYETGIPSKYCSGFSYLSDEQKEAANLVALDVLNDWLLERGMEAVDMNEALSVGRQVEIY